MEQRFSHYDFHAIVISDAFSNIHAKMIVCLELNATSVSTAIPYIVLDNVIHLYSSSNRLLDNKTRFYDPTTGSFIQPNSLVGGNRYAYVENNPLRYNDPSGHCIFGLDTIVCVTIGVLIAFIAFTAGSQRVESGLFKVAQAEQNPEELSNQLEQYNAYETGHSCGRSLSMRCSSAQVGAKPSTPRADLYNEGLTDVGEGTLSAVGGLTYMGGLSSVATINGDNNVITVRHYTDETGMNAISSSGSLNPGTYVTQPSEISPSSGHLQIEDSLELLTGRGANYIDVETSTNNLSIPSNGSVTSGGLWQRQLIDSVPINPNGWRLPPGRLIFRR